MFLKSYTFVSILDFFRGEHFTNSVGLVVFIVCLFLYFYFFVV